MSVEPGRRTEEQRDPIVARLFVALVGVFALVGLVFGLASVQTSSRPGVLAPSLDAIDQRARSPEGASASLDVDAVAERVKPAIVNLTATLADGQGQAAGTGMVMASSGLVVTNNHVIANASAVRASIGNGSVHRAVVLGYDVADDVALLQVQGLSDLRTIVVGASSDLAIDDPIVAIGNALGRGGDPTLSAGTVTALDQTITASDESGGSARTLHGLIQVHATVQPGDSGGAIADAEGRVVGMIVAAASGAGRFGFNVGSSEGYAIPIENVIAIADKIAAGKGTNRIHIGATRGVLGVRVQDRASRSPRPGFPDGRAGSGAVIVGVSPGSGAEAAGLSEGDVIVAIEGVPVTNTSSLTEALVPFRPGDRVTVTYLDASGTERRITVVLSSGPPA